MKLRRLAPLIFALFAAFAFFLPMTAATRTPGENSALVTNMPASRPESAEGAPAHQGFPTAKDLVARFLFSSEGGQAAPSGHPLQAPYAIEFLIATVPDPVSSRLPHFFDSFVESLEAPRRRQVTRLTVMLCRGLRRGMGPMMRSPGGIRPSTRQSPA